MAIVLTNGKYYIATNRNGRVFKVKNIEQAQDFYCTELAMKQKKKACAKCEGYYSVDTAVIKNECTEELSAPKKMAVKRKRFSEKTRMDVYRKTEGHCYLCGDFVDFYSFEIEHKIPLSKGGTNELDNLFCSCHCCNTIKQDIYPEDFMEKVSQIFLYQMQCRSRNSLKWKMMYLALKKLA